MFIMELISPNLKMFLATKMPATMTATEESLARRLKIKEIYFISDQDQQELGLCCSCVIVMDNDTFITLESTPQTVAAVLYSYL